MTGAEGVSVRLCRAWRALSLRTGNDEHPMHLSPDLYHARWSHEAKIRIKGFSLVEVEKTGAIAAYTKVGGARQSQSDLGNVLLLRASKDRFACSRVHCGGAVAVGVGSVRDAAQEEGDGEEEEEEAGEKHRGCRRVVRREGMERRRTRQSLESSFEQRSQHAGTSARTDINAARYDLWSIFQPEDLSPSPSIQCMQVRGGRRGAGSSEKKKLRVSIESRWTRSPLGSRREVLRSIHGRLL